MEDILNLDCKYWHYYLDPGFRQLSSKERNKNRNSAKNHTTRTSLYILLEHLHNGKHVATSIKQEMNNPNKANTHPKATMQIINLPQIRRQLRMRRYTTHALTKYCLQLNHYPLAFADLILV